MQSLFIILHIHYKRLNHNVDVLLITLYGNSDDQMWIEKLS